ncbi:GntR family transcriptional regulator [Parasedimentitalea psychrophila]|uniref:GntR family transcriptional regulator n=1 Tax=Parasedimentitalea psychrophila TaxID=2997337 RepID=A0A9Y2P4Z4_9RHOB|nr:GntR family transcriptional regulator [Parasedimentitalea psychrophila]WIY25844.1 GntR family transcriptional regulator [Parasedimentitalea psychrophila]
MSKQQSNVSRVYAALRQMAADFAFMPDQRINESALSKQLGASRTPLREALNQLVAEGFLTFQNNRGFFCRSLTPKYIQDLYEARVAVECEALRLSCRRASDGDIAELGAYLQHTEAEYENADDPAERLDMDETFHMRLVLLSGNGELERSLRSLNDRIRYIRLIDLQRMRDKAGVRVPGELSAHSRILLALAGRDAAAAEAAMRGHIEKRREAATDAVRIAFSQLYVPQD